MHPQPDVCFLVPVYNHGAAIEGTVAALECYGLHCLLVDDGSDASCGNVLKDLSDRFEWVHLIRRPVNGGKGAAVKDGLRHLQRLGYSHAFQIDADGQHDIRAATAFLQAVRRHPDCLINAVPRYGDDLSRARYYARFLSHVWVWINTLSLQIRDCMCGFRVYPLNATVAVLDGSRTGNRMDFDIEILVRLSWAGVRMVNLEVGVGYPADGVSHFRMVRDNVMISWAHARLFLGMLRRLPTLLRRNARQAKWALGGAHGDGSF